MEHGSLASGWRRGPDRIDLEADQFRSKIEESFKSAFVRAKLAKEILVLNDLRVQPLLEGSDQGF